MQPFRGDNTITSVASEIASVFGLTALLGAVPLTLQIKLTPRRQDQTRQASNGFTTTERLFRKGSRPQEFACLSDAREWQVSAPLSRGFASRLISASKAVKNMNSLDIMALIVKA